MSIANQNKQSRNRRNRKGTMRAEKRGKESQSDAKRSFIVKEQNFDVHFYLNFNHFQSACG